MTYKYDHLKNLPNRGYSLREWLWRLVRGRPHVIIRQPSGEPQLIRRWVIPRNRLFNIYLHHTLKSDEDRALHDHPWPSVSFLLKGKLDEVYSRRPHVSSSHRRRSITPWLPVFRKATQAHRLVVPDLENAPWTLFITGFKVRRWGFWLPVRRDGRDTGFREWVHWEDYRP